MSIKGQKKAETGEQQSFSRKIGIFSGKVVSINPDSEELSELTGMPSELSERMASYEAEYDGEDVAKIVFWMEDEDGNKFSHTVSLIDKDQVSKAGANQKINALGTTSYPKTGTEEYAEWFTSKGGVRNAKVGEASLYAFLQAWMSNFDFKNSEEFQVDIKKLFKGNVKELRSLIGSEYETNVTGMAVVNVKEVTDEDGNTTMKYYQSTHRDFLPGWAYNTFEKKGRNANKTISKWFDSMEGEYGIKGQYYVGLLKDFNPDESIVGASSAKTESSSYSSSEDSDY